MKRSWEEFDGVRLQLIQRFSDYRGWFSEIWPLKDDRGSDSFFSLKQQNLAFSQKKGTLRGLHYQTGVYAQAKIVACMSGEILDAAVDLRESSSTYLDHFLVPLSAETPQRLIIPRGFAHGYLTMTDNVLVTYWTDNEYMPTHEGGLCWNDPAAGIDWGIDQPILSQKDAGAPSLQQALLIIRKGGGPA